MGPLLRCPAGPDVERPPQGAIVRAQTLMAVATATGDAPVFYVRYNDRLLKESPAFTAEACTVCGDVSCLRCG